MKLEMDDKLKHRLIGIAVILSIAIIFLPAILKKSNQRFDHPVALNISLPAKPLPPKVLAKEEREIFKKMDVAQIDLPTALEDASTEKATDVLADVQAANTPSAPPVQMAELEITTPAVREKTIVVPPHPVIKPGPAKIAPNVEVIKPVKPIRLRRMPPVVKNQQSKLPVVALSKVSNQKKSAANKTDFTVQLASFAVIDNAKILTKQLQSKGYNARIAKVKHSKGYAYKVYVGHEKNRNEAEALKDKLADNFQMHGFIVNTGIS